MAQNSIGAMPSAAQNNSQGNAYGDYYMRLSLGPYERPQPFGGVEWKPTRHIYLPLPSELRDDTGVSYTNVNLETVGDVINNDARSSAGAAALRYSGDLIGAAGKGIADFIGSLPTSESVGNVISGGLQSVGSRLFPAEQMTSAVQQATGLAPNPNPSVAFQGPQLREFSFTWTFFPRSREDSLKIQKIIMWLKRAALPENAVSGSGAVLKYPWLARLNFYPWDGVGTVQSTEYGWTANSIVRYKKCFMSAVNVNYNPSNVPAFFKGDGNNPGLPVAVQLTVSFKEIEYFLAKDYPVEDFNDLYNADKAAADAVIGTITRAGTALAGNITAAIPTLTAVSILDAADN